MLGHSEIDNTATHFLQEAKHFDNFSAEYHSLSREDQIAVAHEMHSQATDNPSLHSVHITEDDGGGLASVKVDRADYSPLKLIWGNQVEVFDSKVHANVFGPDSDANPMTWIGVKQAATTIENRQQQLDDIERKMEQ